MAGVGSQLSVAVANPVDPGSVLSLHSTITAGGQVIIGGVRSAVTVKVAEHVAGTSQSLVTVHVTIVVPPHESGATVALLVISDPHPPT
jgi:hypothetical protein